MEVRAKSSNTPYPIWVYGKYITAPPMRPDGTVRPVGHYIDKGGYPGANVYAIDILTFCKQTEEVDRRGSSIYTRDILLYETEEEMGYFIVEDEETAVDVVWGEIMELGCLQAKDIRIIGNMVDCPDFIEGIRYHVENGIEVPYLPALNVMDTAMPFIKLTCLKCGQEINFNCCYRAKCGCGGFLTAEYHTKVYRCRGREKALA